MKKEFLKLTNGRAVRVEVNWNTICNFTDTAGITLQQFAETAQNGEIAPAHLRALAYAAAKEGERMEGRELELDVFGFGELLNNKTAMEFTHIFERQFDGGESQKKSEPPTNRPRIFTRKSSQ